MKKRVLSLALCLVLVVGLFSGLTVNASAGRLDDLKKEIAEKLIKEKIEQLKEEFEIPDLDTEAILSSFATTATSGDFGENSCLHWEVSTGVLSGKTLTISGTGAMPDFDFPNGNLAPWWNYEALGMLTSFGNFKLEGELKKVVIKDGVTNVSDYALFFLPAATQVTLPDSVTSIGRYGIAMCSKLTGLSIPKGVTGIGDFGLAGNGLTAVTLPDGLQGLGRGAFDSCASLTNTTLPAAITAVPGKCFADCTKLLNVKYAGTVTAIGDLAFESCKALTAAPIPETVTAIGTSAFTGCTALTAIDYSGTEAEWAQLTKGENALPEGVTVNFNAPIHHYGSWTGTDPNCTTEGKRTRTCTDDGCGHTEEMTLPARGHYWGIGRVTTLPTETTTGVRTYTCRTYGCNATRTEEIPKLAPRVPVSERFDDVAPNSWAYEDIQYCVDYELMAGVGGGRFEPKTLTTREQLVQILYRLAGAPEVSGETPFTDLTADWYKTAVLWAYQTGVTSGVSETTFAPDTPVTREQVAVFLARFADRVLDRYTPYMWDALFPFQDREQISYYARTAMNWACDLGLIKGIPGPGGLRLEPQSSATREQMAVMIARFCRRLNVWNEPMPEL
mgnify:CR=1 FL=1